MVTRAPIAVLLVSVAALTSTGCHVFESLEDCATNADCAWGDWCNPQGRFCERHPDPVTVGVLLTESGPSVIDPTQTRDVLSLLESEIAGAGGVLGGRPLRFDVRDDTGQCQRRTVADAGVPMPDAGPGIVFYDRGAPPPSVGGGPSTPRPAVVDPNLVCPAVDLTRAFIDDGAAAILGPAQSGLAIEAEPFAAESRVLMVTPSAGSTAIGVGRPEADRFFFRTMATFPRASPPAVALAADNRECSSLAILHTADDAGRQYAAAVSDAFAKTSMSSGANTSCTAWHASLAPGGLASYAEVIARLRDDRAECAVIYLRPPHAVQFFTELEAAIEGGAPREDFPRQWLGGSLLNTNAFLDALRDTPTDRRAWIAPLVIVDVDTQQSTVPFQRLAQLYRAFTGVGDAELKPYIANTFDAALQIVLAIEAAGPDASRDAVRDAYRAIGRTTTDVFQPDQLSAALARARQGLPLHYNGASGDLVLEPDGSVTVPAKSVRVTSGPSMGAPFAFEPLVGADDQVTIAEIRALVAREPPVSVWCASP